MDTTSITVSFIVAIFGVAYPILFQVVSRLDEKYSSILILDLFNKEKEGRYFKITLVIALISIFIYILKLSPLIDFGRLYFLINNSALILLTISTILLIFSFFHFVSKILVYYTPTRFIKYLIKRHEDKENNYEYFKAISDILYSSIKEQNVTITRTISDFLYTAFQKEREKHVNEPVEYPISFYEVVYKAIDELAILKSKKFTFLEYRTIGGLWFFGELGNTKISEKTFTWIWRNLSLAIRYNNDDMIMYYWENAHEYFTYQLKQIFPEYSDDNFEVTNKEEIEMRKKERERFLEFHYAFGGLLLYAKMYNCISRIFNYTNSIPPKYELLPDTLGEIFKRYIEFGDPHERKYPWISSTYYFPKLEGLNADYEIKKWITEYIGLLFIRQYSIWPHLITMKPLELPEIPTKQSEKKIWIDGIDHFKNIIERILLNKELLEITKLDFITDKWLKEQQKPKPVDLIILYKKQIEANYEKTEIEQKISKTKVEEFENTSKKIIKDTINLYTPIFNKQFTIDEISSWYIYGGRTLMDKSAFSDDAGSHYLNYDSIFSEHISDKFKTGISETFFYTKSKTYLLEGKNLFPAIERLNITNEYVIISFAINIDWLIHSFSIEGLSQNSYKNIKIFNFPTSNYHLVGQSFFILKEKDLPNIIYHEIDKEERDKYSLKEIDNEIKLYSSIINLQENEKILNELSPHNKDKDLRKFVLICLSLKTEIKWKNNIDNIMIKLYTKYRERGIPDNLEDVKKILKST